MYFWYTMPAGINFHEKKIKIRVSKALEEKEAAFAAAHSGDTDQQLLFYLNQQALLIHHTPRKREIVGWRYISMRFGDWDTAIRKSGLKPYMGSMPVSECSLIKDEYELQEKLYREHKIAKKQRAAEHKAKMERQKEISEKWRAEHGKPKKKH